MVAQIKEQWRTLSQSEKTNLFKIALCLFMTLFTYPLIRSTTTSLFFVQFGAKNSPIVWLMSIAVLSVVVYMYNKFQLRWSVHRLYLVTALFTTFFLISMLLPAQAWSYPLFIWREVYIVLMIHMLFGYMNSSVNFVTAKILYGPVGAMGSLGGVFGGFFTTGLTYFFSTEIILVLGAILVSLTALIFLSTERIENAHLTEKDKSQTHINPINSIRPVFAYVMLMVIIIALTQFIINLTNFRLNLLFDAAIEGKELKTRYWGYVESSINGISLVTQLLVLPFLYQKLSLKNVHLGLPIFYSLSAFIGLIFGGHLLASVAIVFVLFKGLDYSLFSTSKELLYFPLDKVQRYGAKYLNDMVAYRAAKAIISVVLIYFQSKMFIDVVIFICLFLWVGAVIILFRHPLASKIGS
jgi:AAA family ATP:ADP antiporter